MKILIAFLSDDADFTKIECGATDIFTVALYGAKWPESDEWLSANLETRIEPALRNLVGAYLHRKDHPK